MMKRCLAPSKAALRTWGKQQQFTDSCAGVFAGNCRYLSSIVSYNLPNADELDYQLPPDRIAHDPVHPRDSSKLLICRPKESEDYLQVMDAHFYDIVQLLPQGTLMLANQSKVLAARLQMKKAKTGGKAEVLCLNPIEPSVDPAIALRAGSGEGVWSCFIGGKKIEGGTVLVGMTQEGLEIKALVEKKLGREGHVRFFWEGKVKLSHVLATCGSMPLPPYIHREVEEKDLDNYQTVYAKQEGSVAAPTAGLHFTQGLIEDLCKKDVRMCHVTLHVGAGTFQPIEGDIADHRMHKELIQIGRATILELAKAVDVCQPIVPVGTTSVRTLESLYWLGVGLSKGLGLDPVSGQFKIEQWQPYRYLEEGKPLPSAKEALGAILEVMDKKGLDSVTGETQLMILPGYKFALLDALVTNFHQPRSTLLLLVGAVLGSIDRVLRVYDHALADTYRFLSFGDACFFIPPSQCKLQVRRHAPGPLLEITSFPMRLLKKKPEIFYTSTHKN